MGRRGRGGEEHHKRFGKKKKKEEDLNGPRKKSAKSRLAKKGL